MMARMEIVCFLVHLHVLLQSRQAISLCICYLYANVASHNTPIANMASLPWDRGYSVVTVAMGRFASADSLKGLSFEGFQECFSCSFICFKRLKILLASDLEKDAGECHICIFTKFRTRFCHANIASIESEARSAESQSDVAPNARRRAQADANLGQVLLLP